MNWVFLLFLYFFISLPLNGGGKNCVGKEPQSS